MSTPPIGVAFCSSASRLYNNIDDAFELKFITYVKHNIGDTYCPSASPISVPFGDADPVNASLTIFGPKHFIKYDGESCHILSLSPSLPPPPFSPFRTTSWAAHSIPALTFLRSPPFLPSFSLLAQIQDQHPRALPRAASRGTRAAPPLKSGQTSQEVWSDRPSSRGCQRSNEHTQEGSYLGKCM